MTTSIISYSDTIIHILPATYSGVTTNVRVDRSKNVCSLRLVFENDAAFSSITGTDIIMQLPSDCRPKLTIFGDLVARTEGQWLSGTYYLAAVVIESNGNVSIRGNVNNLKQCKYITGNLTYVL